MSEPARHAFLEYGRHAPKFLVDHFRTLGEHLEDSVGVALGVDKVVAAHLGRALELTVDAAVALLEARRIPRQIHVDHHRRMLQVQAHTARVRRKKHPACVLLPKTVDQLFLFFYIFFLVFKLGFLKIFSLGFLFQVIGITSGI